MRLRMGRVFISVDWYLISPHARLFRPLLTEQFPFGSPSREMTTEEREAVERNYQEIVINQQGHPVTTNGEYSAADTSMVTTVTNMPNSHILVTDHIIAQPGAEHQTTTIYHDQVPDGGEVNYR